MKEVKIIITAYVENEKDLEEIKKLEHHIEYSGITENYPELHDIHVKVEEMKKYE